MMSQLRSGDWVGLRRIRAYALIALGGFGLMIALLAATATGLSDAWNRPLGTDFSNVWTAGALVLQGRPDAAYDLPTHHAMQQATFGAATPFYGWHYPPMFLMLAGLLALLPYLPALLVWQLGTFPLYLAAVRAIVGPVPGWLLPAAAFPAVIVNITHGHNGFLTAALFGFGLVRLDRRPVVAGLLLGAICYKPQFGLLLPLVLAATGRWTAFGAAAACVAALSLAAYGLFGAGTWFAFMDSLQFTRTVVLEQGDTGWEKIQSVFSAARLWGASIPLAYLAQGLATAAVALALVALWRSRAAYELKAAALILGSVLATPYTLDYDMMALGPALAFLAAHGVRAGFAPWEKTLLAALWVVPLVARGVAGITMIPVGVMAMAAVFVLVVRRGLSGTPQSAVGLAAA